MKVRAFRRRTDQSWLHVVMTTEEPEFSVPAATHQEQVATGFGLALDQVEVVEQAEVPDLSAAVAPPPPVQHPIDAAIRRLRQWSRDPADPPPDRAVVLDVIRVLRRAVADL